MFKIKTIICLIVSRKCNQLYMVMQMSHLFLTVLKIKHDYVFVYDRQTVILAAPLSRRFSRRGWRLFGIHLLVDRSPTVPPQLGGKIACCGLVLLVKGNQHGG